METRKTQLALTASALAMALVLVGCGGGGSSSSTPQPTVAAAAPETPPPPPAEPTVNDVVLPTEMPMDYMAPMAGMMTVMAGNMWTPDGSDVVFSCPAGGEDCEIDVMADGTVTSTGGAATAALTTAAAGRLADENKMMAAEMRGRASGKFDALTDAADIRTGTKPDLGNLRITRGLSGGAMVSNGGRAGWEATDAASVGVSGWDGKLLSYKTRSIAVYTNIDAAKRKAYSKRYASPTPAGVTYPTGVAVDSGGVVTLAAANIADYAALLDPTKFPQPKDPGMGSNTYEYSGAAGKMANSFAGTFHGASGTYVCGTVGSPATDCTVKVTAPSTASGPVYTATGSSWTFTPDAKNNPQIVEQDADHMHFGYWVNDPAKAGPGGEFLYDAQVFAGGSMPFDGNGTAIVAPLSGEASYEGPAAGLFAVTENATKGIDAAHGKFMATATLTADFGTGGVGGTPGTVKGTIEDFVRSDGVANSWKLALGGAAISSGTPGSDGAGTGSILDGTSVIGGWNYQLYGSGAKDANPTGIAGAFDAKIDANTAVAGGFGATPK